MGISLKPSTAVVGGLFQDVDVTVTKSRACIYDYNGKVSPAVLAVHMTLTTDDGTVEEQYYSVGRADRFAPAESEDGEPLSNIGDEGAYIVPAAGSSATTLSKSSNFVFFTQEAVNAGFPEDKIESDVSIFEGMNFHAIRKPQQKREGLASAPAEGGRIQTVLVPSKINKYPWDAKGKSKAATAAAGAKGGADVNAVAIKAIQDVLAKSNGSVTPADAKKVAFPTLVKSQTVAVRNEVLGLIVSDKWLDEHQGPDSFIYSDGTITSVA